MTNHLPKEDKGIQPNKKRGRNEGSLNKLIQHALRDLDPRRVENVVDPGTPDICYVGGWVESKYMTAWPLRADRPVRVLHYRPDQRAWHTRHCQAGGVCHVVIQIATDVLVFNAQWAARHLGNMDRDNLEAAALLLMRKWDANAFRAFIETKRMIKPLEAAQWAPGLPGPWKTPEWTRV